jgi:hypothetical protein
MKKQFCVVYRTGGTANFKWQRTVPQDREQATLTCSDVNRAGYPAHVVDFQQSLKIGLPETFEAGDPVEDHIDDLCKENPYM